jgi:hypothetical protein
MRYRLTVASMLVCAVLGNSLLQMLAAARSPAPTARPPLNASAEASAQVMHPTVHAVVPPPLPPTLVAICRANELPNVAPPLAAAALAIARLLLRVAAHHSGSDAVLPTPRVASLGRARPPEAPASAPLPDMSIAPPAPDG